MTILEAKEKQRLEMQSAISLILSIIEVPGNQTGYRTDADKLKGIQDRIKRLNKFNDELFDSIPE